ncbi:hypothetical protein ACFYST_06085 [Kitasatospora sp. NPDC004614]|uniref:hypothetical protein n=1 Tax=unclassified Kitasatospora TaxID=2633591 RepID=UPI0036CFE00A
MSVRPVLGEVALPSAARGSGTVTAGPVAAAGQATVALLAVHCTAASGTTPTLDVSLEESADGSSWSAITGSAVTQITAAGNRLATALVTKNYVRVTGTVAGTTPSFTYSASLLFLPN